MGVFVAILVILFWSAHFFYCLINVEANLSSPLFYFHVLLQTYLYTGLFITAHDAMHGTVSSNKKINNFIGGVSTFLFAGLSYKKLRENHYKHHKNPCGDTDPDFYTKSQNFFLWFFIFMARYVTVWQILIVAVLFNVLKLFYPESSIWAFMVAPAILGTLQLFFFGTYIPHRKPHLETMNPHHARTLPKNHLLAMITCYFFGYHFEHHDAPHTPWWQLYKTK